MSDESVMTINRFCQKYMQLLGPEARGEMLKDINALCTPPDNTLWVETVLNNAAEPLVAVRMGSYSFQLGIDEARKVGRDFFEIANAAECDAFVFEFFTKLGPRAGKEDGIPQEHVLGLIRDFRDWRTQRAKQIAMKSKTPM